MSCMCWSRCKTFFHDLPSSSEINIPPPIWGVNLPFVSRPHADSSNRLSLATMLIGPFVSFGSCILFHVSALSSDRYSAPSSALPILPSSLLLHTTKKRAPSFSRCVIRHANGSFPSIPLFFCFHVLPPSTDLYTPLPN